jgi:hypothetical protein
MKTFEEARTMHLVKLDWEYQELRKVVADPEWCNDMFPGYKKAISDLIDRTKSIMRLNGAECEAKPK